MRFHYSTLAVIFPLACDSPYILTDFPNFSGINSTTRFSVLLYKRRVVMVAESLSYLNNDLKKSFVLTSGVTGSLEPL